MAEPDGRLERLAALGRQETGALKRQERARSASELQGNEILGELLDGLESNLVDAIKETDPEDVEKLAAALRLWRAGKRVRTGIERAADDRGAEKELEAIRKEIDTLTPKNRV